MYAYDLEIFPNFFSATFVDIERPHKKEVFICYDGFFTKRDQITELLFFLKGKPQLVGFNNKHFDDILLASIVKGNTEISDIYTLAQKIITEEYDDQIRGLRAYALSNFDTIDVMSMLHLDAIGVGLKQIAINLQWDWIQDLPFPYDYQVQDEDIDEVLEYNLNDVMITRQLYLETKDEVDLRVQIGEQYELDVRSDSDSSIANSVLGKIYAEKVKRPLRSFKEDRSPRRKVNLKDIISPAIKFQTDPMQNFLEELKGIDLFSKDNFRFDQKVYLGGLSLQMGVGGLHSSDDPGSFSADENTEIIDVDVSSFYPNIILLNKICPEHLNQKAFLSILQQMTTQRLKAKHEGDKVTAQTLKITINSIFGRLGSDKHWLYDPQAFYGVTINGQLYLMMLIEMLSESGFEVISANTDGIINIVPKSQKEEFEKVCQQWSKQTRFELEFTNYRRYVRRDVNNYLAIKPDGKLKTKGLFDIKFRKVIPDEFEMDGLAIKPVLNKGYKSPIIPKALYFYFSEGKSVEETVLEETNPHNFIITQKSNKKFSIFLVENGRMEPQQKTVRFLATKSGGLLVKQDETGRQISISSTIVKVANDLRGKPNFDIDYDYYIAEINKIIHQVQPQVAQMKLF